MTRRIPGWGDVTVLSLRSALREPVFTDFALAMAVQYREVLAEGEDPEGRGLLPETVVDYLEENDDAVTDAMDRAGVSGGYWLFILGAELVVDNLLDDRFSAGALLEKYPVSLGLARALLPWSSIAVQWEVTAILASLLVLVSARRLRALWLRLGLPVLAAGLLALGAWGSSLLAPGNTVLGLVRDAAGTLSLTAGGLLALLGLALLLLNIPFGPRSGA